MKPLSRIILAAAGAVAIFAAIRLSSPTRGLQNRWDDLMDACERHNQDGFTALLADDYSDPWGLNRNEAAKLAHEVFRQFLLLTIDRQQPTLEIGEDGTATTSALIRLEGTGGPAAPVIIQEAEAITTPTVFHWRRMSWKPWDWRLTSLENPGIKRNLKKLAKDPSLGMPY
jgi:hypothetical protein